MSQLLVAQGLVEVDPRGDGIPHAIHQIDEKHSRADLPRSRLQTFKEDRPVGDVE